MRIAIIVKNLTVGGMQRAAINLSEAFADEGHESHLIYLKSKDQIFSPNKNVKLHLFEIEKILKSTISGKLLNLASKIMNAIIRHSYFIWQGYLLTPIFKKKLNKLEKEYGTFDLIIVRGQATFEMIHTLDEDRVIFQQVNILGAKNSIFSIHKYFVNTLFNNKNIVCNAPTIYENINNNFTKYDISPKSLHMIPSPINMQKIKNKSLEYEPEYTNKFIINVGRFSNAKNISFLIDAFAYAKNQLNLKHNLVLVGNGSLQQEYKKQIKLLNIEKYIHFTGSLDNPYPWIKKADLFVFTSLYEGLPNVLLESLSCETNIVSTKGQGGTIDIMNGELEKNLTEFDIEEFAKKIISVLESESKIDYQKQMEPYNIPSVINKYLEIYTKH